MPKIIRLHETSSTNQALHELLLKEKPEEGSVIAASYQTGGRGQGNNKWESENGKNLLFSMVLYPDFIDLKKQFIISEVVSLGIADVLARYAQNVSIKWPNDIYVGNKKITGILIENNLSGKEIESSIIGIGININQCEFISDARNPVSLKQITNHEYDLDVLLKEFMNSIYNRYAQLLEGDVNTIQHEYFNKLFRKEGFHPYQDKNQNKFMAKIIAVKPDGHLVLETENHKRLTFAFKEVEFIL